MDNRKASKGEDVMADAGFKIGDVEYEFPTRFRMVDPVLVEEVTGLEFTVFAARVERVQQAIRDGETAGDASVMAGMVAVAVWQKHPRWKRDRVVAFVNEVDMDAFEAVEPTVVGVDGDDGPPADPASGAESPSTVSSDESITTPAWHVAEPV